MTYSETSSSSLAWCRDRLGCGHERGSADRYQMRVYALAVAVALMGDAICHCGAPISLTDGDVDRTAPGCYLPGVVVMTCHACNLERVNVSGFDSEAFAADVALASTNVPVPSKAAAKAAWQAASAVKGASVRRSKYFKG